MLSCHPPRGIPLLQIKSIHTLWNRVLHLWFVLFIHKILVQTRGCNELVNLLAASYRIFILSKFTQALYTESSLTSHLCCPTVKAFARPSHTLKTPHGQPVRLYRNHYSSHNLRTPSPHPTLPYPNLPYPTLPHPPPNTLTLSYLPPVIQLSHAL
jgi:hypothetical protein